jgi:hypothetical protein
VRGRERQQKKRLAENDEVNRGRGWVRERAFLNDGRQLRVATKQISSARKNRSDMRTHLLTGFSLYHLPKVVATRAAAHAPVMLLEKDGAFVV